MVIVVPCIGGGVLIVGTVRSCCAVSSGRGAFGCAAASSRIVVCEMDAIYVSFTCPWGTRVSITGTFSGANPCGPSVGEMGFLRFALVVALVLVFHYH